MGLRTYSAKNNTSTTFTLPINFKLATSQNLFKSSWFLRYAPVDHEVRWENDNSEESRNLQIILWLITRRRWLEKTPLPSGKLP